jgi:hypothetical protein
MPRKRWQDDFTVGQLTGAAIDGLGVPLANALRNGTFNDITNVISGAINGASLSNLFAWAVAPHSKQESVTLRNGHPRLARSI